MKQLLIFLTAAALLATACSDSEPVDYPPEAPVGVFSVTGDGKITVYWEPNIEPDLDYYAVYSSEEEFGRYELEGTTANTFYTVYQA